MDRRGETSCGNGFQSGVVARTAGIFAHPSISKGQRNLDIAVGRTNTDRGHMMQSWDLATLVCNLRS